MLERMLLLYARHFPVRAGKLRVVDALWRRAAGSAGTQREAVLIWGRFRMPCDIGEMLQRQFYFFGTYVLEAEILACWAAETVRSRVVFDVGANAGIFSLAAMAANGQVVVHAFEPTPEIAARLKRTAGLNGLDALHVHEAAVAARDGRASLHRWRGASNSNEGMNYITTTESLGAETVSTVSLDSFCAKRGIAHIDLLKLDVQGQEALVLAGASRLLGAGHIGTIFSELNWREGPDCPAAEVLAILDRAGYQFSMPTTPLRWRPFGPWLRSVHDVVARYMPAQSVHVRFNP